MESKRFSRFQKPKKMKVDKGIIKEAISEAATLETLRFFGNVLRVHAKHGLRHTQDEYFMNECRDAYARRHAELHEAIYE
jgi:hypothetical protein